MISLTAAVTRLFKIQNVREILVANLASRKKRVPQSGRHGVIFILSARKPPVRGSRGMDATTDIEVFSLHDTFCVLDHTLYAAAETSGAECQTGQMHFPHPVRKLRDRHRCPLPKYARFHSAFVCLISACGVHCTRPTLLGQTFK